MEVVNKRKRVELVAANKKEQSLKLQTGNGQRMKLTLGSRWSLNLQTGNRQRLKLTLGSRWSLNLQTGNGKGRI